MQDHWLSISPVHKHISVYLHSYSHCAVASMKSFNMKHTLLIAFQLVHQREFSQSQTDMHKSYEILLAYTVNDWK